MEMITNSELPENIKAGIIQACQQFIDDKDPAIQTIMVDAMSQVWRNFTPQFINDPDNAGYIEALSRPYYFGEIDVFINFVKIVLGVFQKDELKIVLANMQLYRGIGDVRYLERFLNEVLIEGTTYPAPGDYLRAQDEEYGQINNDMGNYLVWRIWDGYLNKVYSEKLQRVKSMYNSVWTVTAHMQSMLGILKRQHELQQEMKLLADSIEMYEGFISKATDI